jgi:ornithine carbamoyltransferase
MPIRHLLSIADLDPAEVAYVVDRSLAIKRAPQTPQTLAGKSVATFFRKTSTRTRTAFGIGAGRLGAVTIAYGPHDLQTNTGETLEDTGAVLSRMLDALVIRTAAPVAEMKLLASQGKMAVVNAMSTEEHPTQAITDLATMREHFGATEGIRVLCAGEGNNSAVALARALACIPGAELFLFTPRGYEVDPEVVEETDRRARRSGGRVETVYDPKAVSGGVDVVYTTRWQTTGTTKADPNWMEAFRPYAVTRELMARVGKADGSTVFMHDLPAVRGEEVEAEVLDGESSIALEQACNKLYSAMAVLEWCVVGPQ